MQKNSLDDAQTHPAGGAAPYSIAKAPAPIFAMKGINRLPALMRAALKRYRRDRVMAALQRMARQSPDRVRQFKWDGLISCLNVFEALLHHANLKSWYCMLSLSKWAEEAGLATRSKPGRLSVTRAFRALVWLGRFGIVEIKHTKWDAEAGIRLPVFVRVTKLFWELAGSSPAVMLEERERLCKAEGLSTDEQAIVALARQQWREYCELATRDKNQFARLKAAKIKQRRDDERKAKKEAKIKALARRTPKKAPTMAFYLSGIPERLHAGITNMSHAQAIWELYNKPPTSRS